MPFEKRSLPVILCALVLLILAAPFSLAQSAPNYAGKFKGDKLSAEFVDAGGGSFTGTLTVGSNQLPVKAHVANGQLQGTFTSGGNEFPFTAQFAGANLSLSSGGATYSLSPPAANPLAPAGGDAPANPPANPPPNPLTQNAMPPQQSPAIDAPIAGAETFGAFSVLGSTATGKTLFMKLPAGQTLEAAITLTADELGKVLDGKPAITGAFANAQGKDKGGASLTGKLKGKDIKGVMFCGTGANGGSATIVFDSRDASKDDIAALFGFIPKPLKMTTHAFPDGSGSIDLPDGWTTQTQSASNGIYVAGPAGQFVSYGSIRPIYDPNCMTERMRKSNYQMKVNLYQTSLQNYNHMVEMKKQYPNILGPGNPPTPPEPYEPDANINAIKNKVPLVYCKYCDGPDELLKVYYPLLEDAGKKAGVPYTSLDKVIMVVPTPIDPNYPKQKPGVIYIAVTDHDGDKATHVRALNNVTCTNVVAGETWQLSMNVMRAPDETFDKDLPVMSAILGSVKINMQVVGQQIAAQGEATRAMGRQMFAAMEQNHAAWQDQQVSQFHDHEMQIAAQEKATHDSSSDFIEYIGGVRDVYDSQTGQMSSVDLFHSDGIVAGMNAAANDPNRFVQIPLRYER